MGPTFSILVNAQPIDVPIGTHVELLECLACGKQALRFAEDMAACERCGKYRWFTLRSYEPQLGEIEYADDVDDDD